LKKKKKKKKKKDKGAAQGRKKNYQPFILFQYPS